MYSEYIRYKSTFKYYRVRIIQSFIDNLLRHILRQRKILTNTQ